MTDRVFKTEFFEGEIYKELRKHPENSAILESYLLESFSDFLRKGLTNPKSKLFIDHTEFKPSLTEVIDLIHEAGGIAILAHPYQYNFDDPELHLNSELFLHIVLKTYALDGVESFYTTFTDEQTAYLLALAKEKKLLVSGGSDYHAKNKKNHALGVGAGNLNINKDIVSNWNIEYYKK